MESENNKTEDQTKKFCDNEKQRDYIIEKEKEIVVSEGQAENEQLESKKQEIVHKSEDVVKELYKEKTENECFDKTVEASADEISKAEKAPEFKLEPFTPGKIPEIKENIYQKPGIAKKKKESIFLSNNLKNNSESQNSGKIEASKKDEDGKVFKNCKLFYSEDGEMIEMGPGEVHLKEGVFVFIRELFKMTILKFPFASVEFKAENRSVSFKEKGRKSEGETFKIVEREYLLEFPSQDYCNDFTKNIKKQ